ncbi:Non-structural protein NS-S [Prevotella copri]|nr:Non-structural protein NS-S [Segatella copri]
MFCGMGPHGDSSLQLIVNSLQLIVYCLRLISWLFADNLQISC